MIAKAALLEPAIILPHTDPARYPSYRHPTVEAQKFKLLKGVLADLDGTRFDTVLLISEWRRGGAEREAMQLVGAMKHGDPGSRILVLVTDGAGRDAEDWAPRDDIASVVGFHDHARHASPEQRAAVLAHLLITGAPRRVINCNSNVGWIAYERYGRRLSEHTRLEAMLFCYDHDRHGSRCGYAPRFVRSTIDHLAAVYVDNKRFIADLVGDYGLASADASRLHCLYQPVRPAPNAVDRQALLARARAGMGAGRPVVLWAGRPGLQKRVDLLLAIAAAMPEVDFHCYGATIKSFSNELKRMKARMWIPENLHIRGEFGDFHALDLSRVSAFLHTAAWEGLPNVLIEAMAAGLPVVATDVGGVRELIDDETGWLVGPPYAPEHYARELRQALGDAAAIAMRLTAADRRLACQHSAEGFAERLKELGLVPAAGGGRRP
jgi:glycosyltransferase involved in cell wall biosynthesis